MNQENTVRKFRREHDPTSSAFMAVSEGRSSDVPELRRLNINLPKNVFAELEAIAKSSGRTMTEVVRTGLGLVAIALAEEKEGRKMMIIDRAGKPVKEIVLPR